MCRSRILGFTALFIFSVKLPCRSFSGAPSVLFFFFFFRVWLVAVLRPSSLVAIRHTQISLKRGASKEASSRRKGSLSGYHPLRIPNEHKHSHTRLLLLARQSFIPRVLAAITSCVAVLLSSQISQSLAQCSRLTVVCCRPLLVEVIVVSDDVRHVCLFSLLRLPSFRKAALHTVHK